MFPRQCLVFHLKDIWSVFAHLRISQFFLVGHMPWDQLTMARGAGCYEWSGMGKVYILVSISLARRKYTFAISYREPIWGCWGLSQRIWSNGHWDVTPFLSPGCPSCNEWMKSATKCSFSTIFILSTKTKAVLSNLHMPVSLSCFSSGLVFYLPRNF